MKEEKEDLEITSYVHYHEYDYNKQSPIVVLQGFFGSVGYEVDPNTGETSRTCICSAWTSNECCCGGFDLLV